MSPPKLLLVDDEQNVLDSLSLLLARQYTVVTAQGGAAALEKLAADPGIAVIVSDMRMPGMSGAEFLAQAHARAPSTVRMLLTGQSDMSSAIAAVNEGQIFRFLTKPVPPRALLTAVEAAVSQHRLIVAEKVLLEQTLRGSIQTLTDVLALANPELFGRATRIKRVANEVMRKLSLPDLWQVDVAAMLLPLAQISLPAETSEKLCRAGELSDEERAMIARLPEVTDNLLTHIPRLEVVRVILAHAQEPYRQANCIEPVNEAHIVVRGAQLLRLAIDFDVLVQSGLANADAVAAMRSKPERYEASMVEALVELYAASAKTHRILEISTRGLAEGMVLAEDLVTRSGMLLVPRGGEVTATIVERIRNYRAGTLRDSVRIVTGRD
jgi:response regulator RpfG family c-di-GMP phosphodiesterase